MASKLFDEVTKMVATTELKNKFKKVIGALTGNENFTDVYVPRMAYIQTTAKTITNTTTETTLFNDTGAIGSRTIAKNTLRKGSLIRIHLLSDLTNVSNPTNVIKIKIGDTTIITSSAQLGTNATSVLGELYLELLVTTEGASGKIGGQGFTKVVGGTNPVRKLMLTTPTDFNTTVDNELDVTYTWGAASESNIVVCTNATIEVVQ